MFKKTTKQIEAIPVLAKKKYAALYGGSRSGKTFCIMYGLIIRACKTRSRHVIVRRTFSSVKRSIWLDTLPKVLSICFPNLSYKLNKTDYYLTLPNGSEIWLAGLDDSRVEKILGMEFSTIYFNEASELDYSAMQIVISRLAQKNSLNKRVWYDFNPPDKTHWSYWVFIEKINPIDDEPLEDPDDYGYLLINPRDNLENIDEEYIKILMKMPEKDRERFLEGKFSDVNDGGAYHSFNRDRHVGETKKYQGSIFIGLDFNVDPMTAVIAQIVNDTIHVQDEIYLNNSDTHKMCAELIRRGYRGCEVIPDSTGRNRKTSGTTDFKILKDSGFAIASTYNPLQSDRVNNINKLLNEDKILINPKCKKLIADLTKVCWKNNKLDQSGSNKHLTHISDCLGYLAWKKMPFSKIDLTPRTGGR